MRMDATNGFLGFEVCESSGRVIPRIAWVDDVTQEYAQFEYPYRVVGDKLAYVVVPVHGVLVDQAFKTIYVNTGVKVLREGPADGLPATSDRLLPNRRDGLAEVSRG